MVKKSKLFCKNGLGDKLLDIVGFYTICKYLDYEPIIEFNSYVRNESWGTNVFDEKLFIFNGLKISYEHCEFSLDQKNPSISLTPYRVYEFLSGKISISFEEVSKSYNSNAKLIIKNSPVLDNYIPKELENSYGIHLRHTDKISDGVLKNTKNQFENITRQLFREIKTIIENEENPSFLFVSETDEWRESVKSKVLSYAKKKNKNINLISLDYDLNSKSIIDMFGLSKCKKIFQGIGYSSFSILAAILGKNKITNYENTYIKLWSSVLEINDNPKNYKLEFHKRISFGDKFETNMI